MSAIYILWLRELRRYTRSRVQIIASLGQPLLYLLALGFGLGAVFRQAGRGSYIQFVAPGVMAMTVLFSATFSGIALLWDRQFGFLKETLVAPSPAYTSCWAELWAPQPARRYRDCSSRRFA
jgi:ABC-2 type transport system permease protein